MRRARPLAYGLLGLKPWEFARYTVMEFEDAVVGAQIRHEHLKDALMLHALKTGQWTEPTSFEDLTGRDKPLPLDPRVAEEIAPEDADLEADRIARAKAMVFEAQLRRGAEQRRVEVKDG